MSRIPIRDIIIGVNVAEHTRENDSYEEENEYKSFDDDYGVSEESEDYNDDSDLHSSIYKYRYSGSNNDGKPTIDVKEYFKELKREKNKKDLRNIIVVIIALAIVLIVARIMSFFIPNL